MDKKERLIHYLSMFGKVDFENFEFVDGRPKYACITLEAREFVVDELREEIRKKLSLENGYLAFLGFIAMNDLGNGRFRYFAEVIPRKVVEGEDEMRRVTDEYLAALPHAIRDFRLKNPLRGRKHR